MEQFPMRLMMGRVDMSSAVVPGSFRAIRQLHDNDVFEFELFASMCKNPVVVGTPFSLVYDVDLIPVERRPKNRHVLSGQCSTLFVRTDLLAEADEDYAFVYEIQCTGGKKTTA